MHSNFETWREMLTPEDISDEELSLVLERDDAKQTLRNMVQEKVSNITSPSTKVKGRGDVEVIVEYTDGSTEVHKTPNTILRNGKIALASSLANEVADPYDFYIESMIFGSGGATGGTAKFVEETRNGLFGTTLLTKNVISSIDPSGPTTAILTSVVGFDEAVGHPINEMALVMKSGDLYSMVTFPDLNKTASMQLTINWRVTFL